MSIFSAIIDAIVGFWVKQVLNRIFPEKPPAQTAVNTEAKMAQDIVDEPTQAQAVKTLEDDEA
jgi:hypothetical protein